MLALLTDESREPGVILHREFPRGGQEEKAARKFALSNPKQIQSKQKQGLQTLDEQEALHQLQ